MGHSYSVVSLYQVFFCRFVACNYPNFLICKDIAFKIKTKHNMYKKNTYSITSYWPEAQSNSNIILISHVIQLNFEYNTHWSHEQMHVTKGDCLLPTIIIYAFLSIGRSPIRRKITLVWLVMDSLIVDSQKLSISPSRDSFLCFNAPYCPWQIFCQTLPQWNYQYILITRTLANSNLEPTSISCGFRSYIYCNFTLR